ncbi:MAG: sulfate/molybdate ABC transporter ATP-binding protein [Planctomycetota bacterium]
MNLDVAIRAHAGNLAINVIFNVTAGDLTALIGPNGAGKTTILRSIAGLSVPEVGFVRVDHDIYVDCGELIYLPPEKRDIGFVLQDITLFPHLTVRQNIEFGARARGRMRQPGRPTADDWIEKLNLRNLQDRKPARLSGGEAKRVAIARALATNPKILLLDEPFSGIDTNVRAEIRRDLRLAVEAFGGICILVTHDPVEALSLAKKIIILENGCITQEGSIADVSRRPMSRFAAEFIGVNFYEGFAQGGIIKLQNGAEIVATAGEGRVFAVVPANAVSLHINIPSGSARNTWAGTVLQIDNSGDRLRVRVEGRVSYAAEITQAAAESLHLKIGSNVWGTVKATEVVVYPAF